MWFEYAFAIFPIMFGIVFFLIVGVTIFAIVRGAGRWSKNNHSPKISARVRVVARRSSVSGGGRDHMAHSSYYVTFEFDTRDRLELAIPHNEFGLIAEGDAGTLTFQGTRFLSFRRD